MFKLNNKDNNVINVVQVSVLLTLSIFHTITQCFCCCKCLLGLRTFPGEIKHNWTEISKRYTSAVLKTFLTYFIVNVCLETNISQTLRVNNQIIFRIKNVEFSGYYFCIKTNIKGNSQICISVTLKEIHVVTKGYMWLLGAK